MSVKTTRNLIAKLVEKRYVERVGAKKSGRWIPAGKK